MTLRRSADSVEKLFQALELVISKAKLGPDAHLEKNKQTTVFMKETMVGNLSDGRHPMVPASHYDPLPPTVGRSHGFTFIQQSTTGVIEHHF